MPLKLFTRAGLRVAVRHFEAEAEAELAPGARRRRRAAPLPGAGAAAASDLAGTPLAPQIPVPVHCKKTLKHFEQG